MNANADMREVWKRLACRVSNGHSYFHDDAVLPKPISAMQGCKL